MQAIVSTDDPESVRNLYKNWNTCQVAISGQQPPCTVQCNCNACTQDAMQCLVIRQLARAISKGAWWHQARFICGWMRSSATTMGVHPVTLRNPAQFLHQNTYLQVKACMVTILSLQHATNADGCNQNFTNNCWYHIFANKLQLQRKCKCNCKQ